MLSSGLHMFFFSLEDHERKLLKIVWSKKNLRTHTQQKQVHDWSSTVIRPDKTSFGWERFECFYIIAKRFYYCNKT